MFDLALQKGPLVPYLPTLSGQNIALVAVFAGLIAASTLPPEFSLGPAVPISLQTLAVVLAGLVLGAWRGFAATALYVLVGLAGAPIFANAGAGWATFVGPTGGYIWAFPLAAFVVGWSAEKVRARASGDATFPGLLGAGLISVPVIYAIGVPWLAHVLDVPIFTPATEGGGTAAAWGMAPFVTGDVIKVFVAAGVATAIHRAFPQLLSGGEPFFRSTSA